jgi:hypothetical protein
VPAEREERVDKVLQRMNSRMLNEKNQNRSQRCDAPDMRAYGYKVGWVSEHKVVFEALGGRQQSRGLENTVLLFLVLAYARTHLRVAIEIERYVPVDRIRWGVEGMRTSPRLILLNQAMGRRDQKPSSTVECPSQTRLSGHHTGLVFSSILRARSDREKRTVGT